MKSERNYEIIMFCVHRVHGSWGFPWCGFHMCIFPKNSQSYIYQVLQTIHMKLILLCVWAESAVLGSAKTALKFMYKIQIGYYSYTIQCMGKFISFKSEINNPWFNPWFILLHTHSNVCATVEGRCLEYLVCITLADARIFKRKKPMKT